LNSVSLTDHWEVDAFAALGAICVVLGVWIRSGGFRGALRSTYFARGLPDHMRHTPFAFIPLGAAFLLLIAGASHIASFDAVAVSADDADALGSILVVLGLVGLGIGCWWMFRPPEWVKPTWIREYERAQRAGHAVLDFSPEPMSPRAYTLNWLGLAAMAVIWLAIGLPLAALLIGLGFGMSMLLANRPRGGI
jgi:hypothetical protein